MDWDLKVPSWDLGELDQNAELHMGSGVGSSVVIERQTSRLDCSVDLKLGGFGDFGSSEKWVNQPAASAMASTSGSSKRARVSGNNRQNVSCAVDGCKSDLNKCRDYHRRHKVCEAHSKTPIVVVGGQEQRFCQQCSRFHLLVEFDEIKRSCRKRLDGHNRRRRKSQPEYINSRSLFLNHQGTGFSSYPHIFPSATPDPNWVSFAKIKEDMPYTHHPPMHFNKRQQHFLGPSIMYEKGGQFPFTQDDDVSLGKRMAHETSVCHEGSGSSSGMFSDRLAEVLDSDCAFSLLSSPTRTPNTNLGLMSPADGIRMGQPMISGLQLYNGDLIDQYSHSQGSTNVTAGFSRLDIGDQSVSMFHVAGEGSSDRGSLGLPFRWQ